MEEIRAGRLRSREGRGSGRLRGRRQRRWRRPSGLLWQACHASAARLPAAVPPHLPRPWPRRLGPWGCGRGAGLAGYSICVLQTVCRHCCTSHAAQGSCNLPGRQGSGFAQRRRRRMRRHATQHSMNGGTLPSCIPMLVCRRSWFLDPAATSLSAVKMEGRFELSPELQQPSWTLRSRAERGSEGLFRPAAWSPRTARGPAPVPVHSPARLMPPPARRPPPSCSPAACTAATGGQRANCASSGEPGSPAQRQHRRLCWSGGPAGCGLPSPRPHAAAGERRGEGTRRVAGHRCPRNSRRPLAGSCHQLICVPLVRPALQSQAPPASRAPSSCSDRRQTLLTPRSLPSCSWWVLARAALLLVCC